MSASEMHRRSRKLLVERREAVAERVHSIRYEFAQIGTDGAVVAPPSAENIAMRVVESNACVRTYDDAIRLLDEAFKEMTAPDTKAAPRKPREAPYQ